jgi:NAD(P)-dependent dehydrogenase (short-subunit alcohol dehydrogenase family)
MKPQKTVLIIGGTSGLGLAFARTLRANGSMVFVTGRENPTQKDLNFLDLDVGDDVGKLTADLDRIVDAVPHIDLLIYSAGFFQQGTIAQLSDSAIGTMINLGLSAPALLIQKILRAQRRLPEVILVTSTSQEIPRLQEPVYAAVKAGLAMLGNSCALDPQIEKTMVIAPAGMDTTMWQGGVRPGTLLDPQWVADEALHVFESEFTYYFIRVLRDPARMIPVEKR